MYLHKIPVKRFDNDWGEIDATWVGQDGPGLRQILVPVREMQKCPPNMWAVHGSTTGRPVIECDAHEIPGWIVRMSSYRGPSHAIGYIYVAQKCLDTIQLLAHGRGTNRDGRGLWQEAIVVCPTKATFYVMSNNPPDYLVEVDDKEVNEREVTDTDVYYSHPETWVRIDYQLVPRWRATAQAHK